jgi:DNA-binding transcriptional MocR family regulator
MIRHARYFQDVESVSKHMERHAKILRPKFELVIKTMERDLSEVGCGKWISPKGGYFITFEAPKGTATRIVDLAAEAGVKLTPAGAQFPYHMDPNDSIIRFAPSLPPLEELEDAANIFTVCARIAYLEKLILAKSED